MVLGVEAEWGQSYLEPHPGEGIQTNLEAWHKQTARVLQNFNCKFAHQVDFLTFCYTFCSVLKTYSRLQHFSVNSSIEIGHSC